MSSNIVQVVPGPGIVIRIGAVVAWAEPADLAPSSPLATVIELLDRVADGLVPVEELGGQLLGILTGDAVRLLPALALVVPGPAGPIAIAHGWGQVVADGVLVAGAWSVRQLQPMALLALGRSDVAQAPTAVAPTFDLRDGIVPGGAAVLSLPRPAEPAVVAIAPPFPADAPMAASPADPGFGPPAGGAQAASAPPLGPGPAGFGPPPADAQAPVAEPMPTATSGTLAPAQVAPAGGAVLVSLTGPLAGDLERREPLPVHQPLPVGPQAEAAAPPLATDGSAAPPDSAHVHVQGVVCSRRHFNNPIALYCRVCGISMLQQTHVLVDGDRPPLGVLVCDDGTTFGLDQDYVVGAAPEGAPEVLHAGARPLALGDPGGSVEPIHALVHLDGWNVTVVNQSAAGTTWVLERATGNWMVVPRDGAVRLDPGAQVAVGARRFVFESNARA